MQIQTLEQLEAQNGRIDLSLREFDSYDDQPTEPFYTGNQHGLNWETYASDDEPLSDLEPELDHLAYEDWALTNATYDEEIYYANYPVVLDRIVY